MNLELISRHQLKKVYLPGSGQSLRIETKSLEAFMQVLVNTSPEEFQY